MEAILALVLILLGIFVLWALFTGKISFPFGSSANG